MEAQLAGDMIREHRRGIAGTYECLLARECFDPTNPRHLSYAQQQCSLHLADVEKRLRESGLNVRSESRLGNAVEEIVDYASENDIDLIVMASHGHSGVSKWISGSVTDKVLHSTCVPILIIRASDVCLIK